MARDPGIGMALAVNPDGSMAFVAGTDAGAADGDLLTVAHDTATGARLWTARFGSIGPASQTWSIAVSPDGTRVFVAGSVTVGYATVCYDAATGTPLWSAVFTGQGVTTEARSIAVSPDGTKVFVTGFTRTGTTSAYATVAYDTTTGTQLWAARYSGPASDSEPVSVAVSPTGSTVFITGASLGRTGQEAYATLAYRAATGTRLWAARYTDQNRGATPAGLAVSSTGQVYVTGTDRTRHGIQAYATVAYNPDTGKRLWLARYNGLGQTNSATAITVTGTGTGTQVFVTGQSKNPATGNYDYATVAYSAATGKQRWVARYFTGLLDLPAAIAAGPHGSEVVVTGYAQVATPGGTQYATVAYRAATGTMIWARRYGIPPISTFNQATAVAFIPRHPEVIVTGLSADDAATIAYRA